MMVRWVLLVMCWSPLAVGCDDGDPCGGYKADYEALVAGAKACSADEDCQILQVRCEMVGNCGEHVNHSLEAAELNSLTTAWMDDGCQGGAGISCCDGGVPPAEAMCVEGQCGPAPDPIEACNDAEPGWKLLMIIDRPNNEGECHPEAPGADIDAVEVYRDGVFFATAVVVREVEDVQRREPGAHPCEDVTNPNDDPEALLGLEDHTAGQEIGGQVYSLAGRAVFLELSERVSDDDTIIVYEVDSDDDEEEDCFNIYFGYDTCEGDMAFTDPAFSGWGPPPPFPACGTAEGTIYGLW
jgi:hypothetical protein